MLRELSQLPALFWVSVHHGVRHFSFGYTGMLGVDASVSAVLFQLQRPFAVMPAMIVFKERPFWWRMSGIVVAFSEVVVLAGEPRTSTALGSAALVVAGDLMWAVGSILVKRMDLVEPFALHGWIALFSASQFLIASMIFETGQANAVTSAGWVGVVYTVLGVTILGWGIWYWLLQRYKVNQVMPLNLITPVFGLLAGIIFLSEPVASERVVGAGIILLGVAVRIFEGRARPWGTTL